MQKVKTPYKKNIFKKYDRPKLIVSKPTIHLDEVPEPDFDMTYTKASLELIKYFTAVARKTPEYKAFIQFLKNYLDISKCSFFENYSMKNGFIIELHHHPFSLFDICEAVSQKQLSEKNYIETFSVIEEVLLLHYKFWVGLIPLNPTAHDLVHMNELKLYPQMLVGEWKNLYKEYFPYLSQTAIKKYDELIEAENKKETLVFPDILKMKPIKVSINGIENVIDEKELNKLMIEKKMKEVDKLSYNKVE
jgi:hypothetical protein